MATNLPTRLPPPEITPEDVTHAQIAWRRDATTLKGLLDAVVVK